jgi:CheY-like chemotaxis protein
LAPNPHTILLVEDDPNDVFMVTRAFRKARIANPLQCVSDGEDAIAYLAGTAPYTDRERYPLPLLILLDLKLPRKGGLEVLAWARAQEVLKRIPVVILTSSREDRDIRLAYDLSVNSYLVKPVNFEALFGMVKTLNMYWLMLNEAPPLDEPTHTEG